MMRVSIFLLLFWVTGKVNSQSAQPIKKDQIVSIFNPVSGVWVINSWATYCKPCLEEMELFVKADSLFKGQNIHFVFLSFDFADDSLRVNRMIKKLTIPGRHFIADESDMNMLINAIDSSWSGALPATWFVSPLYKKPVFYGFRQFDDIKQEIEQLISASNEE